MKTSDRLLNELRTWRMAPAGHLQQKLGISRATLMRAVKDLDEKIVSRGQARRTAYAARRPVRGSWSALTVYRIDQDGSAHEAAKLYPLYAQGCALEFLETPAWPLNGPMADGWFEGLPYFLDDMRPQGFLGRHFAQHNANLLQLNTDPKLWSEDDVLHALSLLGTDTLGNHVLGESAMRLVLAQPVEAATPDHECANAYTQKAITAMTAGQAGSSVAGEFPKFTAYRQIQNRLSQVIVKFSGSDGSPGSVRWSDLLVCEHLALSVMNQHLGVPAATSSIYQFGGRTFLEVERFDRVGAQGRLPVCSWAALNAALVGKLGRPWPQAAQDLVNAKLLSGESFEQLQRLWLFGKLIANSDMHDGNLAFTPGLQLAPAYDMLPMAYAPVRGVEIQAHKFTLLRPLPSEQAAWTIAAQAASTFWSTAAQDPRISDGFRTICEHNTQQFRV
jgi:hypothetical protein